MKHRIVMIGLFLSIYYVRAEPIPTSRISILEQTTDFLSRNPVASLLILFVGFVGSVASLLSWWSARRSAKAQDYLFHIAQLHVDKSVTEKQLADRRKEIDSVSKDLARLEAQIRSEIPIAARRAVLTDRLEALKELLSRSHTDLQQVVLELKKLGLEPKLDPHLLRLIHSEIEPSFVIRDRLEFWKTWLAIFSSAAGISKALLPYQVGTLCSLFFMAFALATLIPFLRAFTQARRLHIDRDKVALGVFIGLHVIGIMGAGLAALIGAAIATAGRDTSIGLTIVGISLLCAAALSVSLFFASKRRQNIIGFIAKLLGSKCVARLFENPQS